MYSASMKAHGLKQNAKPPHTTFGGNVYTLPQPGPKKQKSSKKDRGRSMGPDNQSRKTLKSGTGGRKRDNSQWTANTNLGPANTFSSGIGNKPISREEQLLIREVEDEFKRRGHLSNC